MQPQLPFDVIDEVLRYCSKQTLTNCALVNRDFLKAARAHLYLTLELTDDVLAGKLLMNSTHLLHLTRHLTLLQIDFATSILEQFSRHNALVFLRFIPRFRWIHEVEAFLNSFSRTLNMGSLQHLRTRFRPLSSNSLKSDGFHRFVDLILSFKGTLDLDFSWEALSLTCLSSKPLPEPPLPQATTLRFFFPSRLPSESLVQVPLFLSRLDLSILRRVSLHLSPPPAELEVLSALSLSLPPHIEELSISFSVRSRNLKDTMRTTLEHFPSDHFTSLKWLSIFFSQDASYPLSPPTTCYFVTSLIQNLSQGSRYTLNQINVFLEWICTPDQDHSIQDARANLENLAHIVSSLASTPNVTLHAQVTDNTTDVPTLGNVLLSVFPKAKVTVERELMFEDLKVDNIRCGHTMDDSWPYFSGPETSRQL